MDTVGAGEGEIVMWAGGSSSRQTDLTTNKPVDSSIVGIVDFVDILGKRGLRQGECLMKIARVTGTVVSTVKYEKYRGYKLLKVRHLTLEGELTGEELIALDAADAGIGDIVLVNNDGGAAQMVTGRQDAHRKRHHLRRGGLLYLAGQTRGLPLGGSA